MSSRTLPGTAPIWISLFLALAASAQDVLPGRWAYTRLITLNTTAAGANVAVAQTRFPVLIRLGASEADVFAGSQGRGRDIRFAKVSGAPLRYQIERWDSAAAQAAIWVLADTVKGNATQTLRMYWGNPAAADSSKGPAVFDTADGFQAVWHFNEATGDSARDATLNGFSAAPKEALGLGLPADAPGMIGKAKAYKGNANGSGGGYYVVPNSIGSKLDFPMGGRYTVSAWANTDIVNKQFRAIVTGHDQQYALDITGGDLWEFNEFNNATGKWGWQDVLSPAAGHEGKWKHIVGVRDGAKEYLYIDGVLATDVIKTNVGGSAAHLAATICIGKRGDNLTRFWAGKIDEVQMSNVARSADWVKLSYANQSASQNLVAIGPTAATGIGLRPRAEASEARALRVPAAGRFLIYPAGSKAGSEPLDLGGRRVPGPLRAAPGPDGE